jgi:hypothetical protein
MEMEITLSAHLRVFFILFPTVIERSSSFNENEAICDSFIVFIQQQYFLLQWLRGA